MKDKKRVPTSGEPILWKSPFATLKSMDLPLAPEGKPPVTTGDAAPPSPKKIRGRVDIIRQTDTEAGRP